MWCELYLFIYKHSTHAVSDLDRRCITSRCNCNQYILLIFIILLSVNLCILHTLYFCDMADQFLAFSKYLAVIAFRLTMATKRCLRLSPKPRISTLNSTSTCYRSQYSRQCTSLTCYAALLQQARGVIQHSAYINYTLQKNRPVLLLLHCVRVWRRQESVWLHFVQEKSTKRKSRYEFF